MRQLVRTQESNHIIGNRRYSYVLPLAIFLTAMLIGCSKEAKKAGALRSEIDASDTTYLKTLEGTGVYVDGWVGDAAKVTLGNPRHSRAFAISGVNVQTGAKDESLGLKFEFMSGKTDSVAFSRIGPFKAMLFLPIPDAAADTLQLMIVSSKTFVPSKLGTSQDDRVLSFRFEKISVVDLDSSLNDFPASYEFPRKDETERGLIGVYKDGWMADSAVVFLYNLQGKSSVEIRGFVPPDIFTRIADLEVRVNGVLLVKEQLPKQNQGYFRSIISFPEDVAALASIPLTLKPSGTFVPYQRGINADTRRLSYQLQYVGLR